MTSFLVDAGRFAIVVALLLTGCATAPPTEENPARTPLRGIDFEGDRVPASGPWAFEGSVTLTNRRTDAATLTFPDPCLALIRVYEVDRTRQAPVWDQASSVACDGEPVVVELSPGESRSMPIQAVSGTGILGDSLPEGRYRITAYVRPDGRVIEVELGEADLSVSP